jgi:hypothetical protein
MEGPLCLILTSPPSRLPDHWSQRPAVGLDLKGADRLVEPVFQIG